jgi:alpha-L-fucosidase
MYLPGRPEYQHHIATYGSLDRFGYKDFAAAFTAEHFDADAWVTLFKQAGARYIGPVAEHADGFAMWDSRVNCWNAVRLGPHRDVVAEMERAVRKQGLKFLATFHHQWLWGWYTSPVLEADILPAAVQRFLLAAELHPRRPRHAVLHARQSGRI